MSPTATKPRRSQWPPLDTEPDYDSPIPDTDTRLPFEPPSVEAVLTRLANYQRAIGECRTAEGLERLAAEARADDVLDDDARENLERIGRVRMRVLKAGRR